MRPEPCSSSTRLLPDSWCNPSVFWVTTATMCPAASRAASATCPGFGLAAGVAASEACGAGIRLKWPNDLLLDNRKVGGILVETTPQKAICGIGVNLTWAPEGAAMLDRPREPLFDRLRTEIDTWAAATPDAVVKRWRELSATLGRRVRIEVAGEATEGLAQGITAGGELIVDGKPFIAGTVTHL